MVTISTRDQALISALGPAAAASGLVASAAARKGSALAVGVPVAAAALLAGAIGGGAWWALDVRRRLRYLDRVIKRSDQRTAQAVEAVAKELRAELFPAVHKAINAAAKDSEARTAQRIAETAKASTGQVSQVPEQTMALVEPLISLNSLLRPRAPMPSMLGFAAAGDLLLTYVGEILRRRPKLVVECGSGVSTLVAAYALELVGNGGRVVALEDGEQWVERTRGFLSDHNLEERAEVRLAPITEVDVRGEARPWYDLAAVSDLDGIGVLLVDGPVGSLAPMSRYPAVPVLREKMAPGAVVLLDDVGRQEEDRIAHRWAEEWEGLTQSRLPHVKGTALLLTPDGEESHH